MVTLDRQGNATAGFDSATDLDAPVPQTNASSHSRVAAAVAAPSASGQVGLIVYLRENEVWGSFFSEMDFARSEFQIGRAAAIDTESLQVVRSVAEEPMDDDFVVTWIDANPATIGNFVMARRVKWSPDGGVFFPLPARSPEEGEVVLPISGIITSIALVASSAGQVALLWLERGTMVAEGGSTEYQQRLWLQSFDEQLRSTTPSIVLEGWHPTLLEGGLVAAYDQQSVLAAWTQLVDSKTRVVANTYDLSGRHVRQAPATPIRLGSDEGANDATPAVTALPNGGFLVGWTQTQPNAKGHLYGIVLNGDGTPRFNALACGPREFALAAGENEQTRPALAVLSSAEVAVAWTDSGPTDRDSSRSVWGTILSLGGLLLNPERPAYALPSASDAGLFGCAAKAGTRTAGMPCSCSTDCVWGANCTTEEQSGLPMGVCAVACDVDTACGASEVCRSGLCQRRCDANADCSAGRRCLLGTCMPFCVSDEECASGHCDLYRGKCSDGTPLSGKGLDEPCIREEDCRSRTCGIATHSCTTSCVPGRGSCPQGGQCFSSDGEHGFCHSPFGSGSSTGMMPCESTLDCRAGTGAECSTEGFLGYPGGACFIPCDDGGSCSALERCFGSSCFTLCEVGDDGGIGRACGGGTWTALCSSDADCHSGQCDRYRARCAEKGEPRPDGGLDAPCARHEECRSGFCSPATNTCRTLCQVSHPFCPENAICRGSGDNDDVGQCHRAPNSVGMPCEYLWDCADGVTCSTEATLEGEPGGSCVLRCSGDGAETCGPGGTCYLGLLCETKCSAQVPCGASRICSDGVCMPFCSQDSECRSGHCNRYTAKCDLGGTAAGDGGVDAPCSSKAQCKSGWCGFGHCLTPCRKKDDQCPDGTRCIGVSTTDSSDEEEGWCHKADQGTIGPCEQDWDCLPGGVCLSELLRGFPSGVCLFGCADGVCAPGETCGVTGLCWKNCTSSADCGGGSRICAAGLCDVLCATDADCPTTGHCNRYSGLCNNGQAPTLGGIDAPCANGGECNSRVCAAGKCLSKCRRLAPNCPEGARCVDVDAGELGDCHFQ